MAHRSIVIPKGTVNPDKTTVVRIPITPPANTSPLMVTNRRENLSQPFRPNITQSPQSFTQAEYPQVTPQNNTFNQSVEGACPGGCLPADQDMQYDQTEYIDDQFYVPQNQYTYCTDNGAYDYNNGGPWDNTGPDQIPEESQNYYDGYVEYNENVPFQSQNENYDELDCYCSESAPCRSKEEDYVEVECYCSEAAPCQTTTHEEVNNILECRCSSSAPCQIKEKDDQCRCSDRQNENEIQYQNIYTESYDQDEGIHLDYIPCPSSNIYEQTYERQYTPCPLSVPYENTMQEPTPRYNEEAYNPEVTYIPCPTANGSHQQQYTNGQEDWTYQDQNFPPEEVEPDRNCRITHVSYRNYSQVDEEPIEGKTFVFDDPQRVGVSPMAFEELAQSTLYEPALQQYEERSRIPACSDNAELFNQNYANYSVKPEKECDCFINY